MSQLQERSLHRQKEQGCYDVDAKFDADERRGGGKIDIVRVTEFADGVDDEFLNEVGAVSDAGDEGGARNFEMTKR